MTAAYLQIEQDLVARIRKGDWQPGTRLPAERDLAEQLGVSRMTLRQALGRLEQEGLLLRQQGRGTFVREPKLTQRLSLLSGFFDEMLQQGVQPSSRVLAREEIPARPGLADVLGLAVGAAVYKIVRVRLASGSPVVMATSFLPAARVPGLLQQDLERESIYHLMAQCGARPVRAVQSLEPALAGDAEADALEIPRGSPVMLIERTAWDAGDRPVEYAKDTYRGDRSRFVAEMTL